LSAIIDKDRAFLGKVDTDLSQKNTTKQKRAVDGILFGKRSIVSACEN